MKTLAIIKDSGFGVRDCGRCVWFFDVAMDEGSGALLILSAAEAIKVFERHEVYDVKGLKGKPCWVETDGSVGTVKFIDLARL